MSLGMLLKQIDHLLIETKHLRPLGDLRIDRIAGTRKPASKKDRPALEPLSDSASRQQKRFRIRKGR